MSVQRKAGRLGWQNWPNCTLCLKGVILLFFYVMRSIGLCFLLVFMIIASACTADKPANPVPKEPVTKNAGGSKAVLIELFTSEGCGNCPPADKQLAFLETQQPVPGADVITLGYHVDYFNDRGWKDEYSSADHTKRQQLYSMRMNLDTIYTPQMIVDGRSQFIGSDPAKAGDAILKAAKSDKGEVVATRSGRSAQIKVTGLGQHNVATAVLVSAEDGLVSKVKAGNNIGKTLSHSSVVRKVQGFGKVPEKAAEFTATVELPTDPAWKTENTRYVVYVQEDMSGRIIAVGRVK